MLFRSPMATSNTLWELDFDRMLPDGACPTVHRSTASPSLVNPKRSTSPRPMPVYQRATVHWRSCAVRRRYTHPPPLADGTCSTVHHSTANSGIANPDCCTLARCHLSFKGNLYVGGVTQACRTLSRKVTVGSGWPAVTAVPHRDQDAAEWKEGC